jgi:hypothetical protein
MVNLVGLTGFLGVLLLASTADASALVKCEAIKRGASSSSAVERGLRISHFYYDETHKPVTEGSVKALWFGSNAVLRDQALEACQEKVASFECRQDGPSHTSYGRGGVSVKSTAWALHEGVHGTRETFQNPPFLFMSSASEQCYAELIDRVVRHLEKQFSL